MIRLIATDLDDTLLNGSGDLTGRTRRALRAAMDAGIGITLSSGRMLEAMEPIAQRIGVNAPMILYNGAMIYDHLSGETLFADAIPAELAARVARAVEDMGIYIQGYPGRGYFCNEKTPHTRAYENQIHVQAQAMHRPVSEWIESDMVKMLAIDTPEGIAAAQEKLKAMFPTGLTFMRSKAHYLEIVAEGIDKGRALCRLGERLGIPIEDIMAFGDGQNDASMIAAAGVGVAMENAVDECKAVAKRIAPPNTRDGVACVIEELLEGR